MNESNGILPIDEIRRMEGINCGKCKFWRQLSEREQFVDEHPAYLGKCLCPKFVYEYSKTTPIKDGYRYASADSDGLLYWDAEGYYAGFLTGEDFGCIHFEDKRFDHGEQCGNDDGE